MAWYDAVFWLLIGLMCVGAYMVLSASSRGRQSGEMSRPWYVVGMLVGMFILVLAGTIIGAVLCDVTSVLR